jgi:hypothetical protein
MAGGLRAAAIVWIALCVLVAMVIVLDLLRRKQTMWIMNAVWPLTALYAGVLALAAYAWFGRAPTQPEPHACPQHHGGKPFWQATLVGAMHCGAGCALGDFAAEWLAFATGFALF